MRNYFKMRVMFVILIQLLLCNFLQAQVSGVVLDNQEKPIEFANVMLCNSQGTCILGTTTDEKGSFKILTKNLDSDMYIEISFIGYKEKKMKNIRIGKPIRITLEEDCELLGEVVIKGSAAPIKMRSGSIVANVAGTVLSREINATELLRKIPGMMLKNDKLTSFFGGATLIYINGRKINSMDEINQLEVKNIKNVELNTNPGAEYDASVGAVMHIITKKRLEGLSMQIESMLKKGHKISNSQALKVNYNTNGLNIFGTINYLDWKRELSGESEAKVHTPDIEWRQISDSYSKNNIYKRTTYSLGANYAISKKQNIGLKYDGMYYSFLDDAHLNMKIYSNEKLYNNILSITDMDDTNYSNHINGYYNNQLSDKFKLEMYADYMYSYKKRDQDTDEYGNNNSHKVTDSDNESNYKLMAINPKLRYKLNDNNKFSFGLEYSDVKGDSELDYKGIVKGKKNKTDERKFAGFIDYSYSKNSFSMSAGIRYENVKSDFTDLLDNKNSISKNYGNVFPSLSLSYKIGKVSNTLTYRSGIKRPNFGKLNNYSYYMNQFLRQEGNPQLTSQIFHQYQYSIFYKWLLFKVNYIFNKDFIGTYYYNLSQASPVIISTWTNYKKEQTFDAMVNIHPHFGIYEPSLTLAYTRRFMDFDALDGIKMKNEPLYYAKFNNDIKLPKGFLLNAEYIYNGGGSAQIYQLEDRHRINVKIQKAFLNDNLLISFVGKDIFRTGLRYVDSVVNNIYLRQKDDDDRLSYFSLNVVWRFNNYKKTYRGRSAAKDQMNRM